MDEIHTTHHPAAGGYSNPTRESKEMVLDDMLHCLRADLVREPIAEKINEFQTAITDVAQKSWVFFLTTERIDSTGQGTIADEHTIVDAAHRLIHAVDAILEYLRFMEEKTGIPSGGDPSLESEVYCARYWANCLLAAFKALKKLERAAGGLVGMTPSVINTVDDKLIILKYDAMGPFLVLPSLHHPVIRTPGTTWHKFFCGEHPDTEIVGDRFEILTGKPQGPKIQFVTCDTNAYMNEFLSTAYEHYSDAHQNAGQLPIRPHIIERRLKNIEHQTMKSERVSRPKLIKKEFLNPQWEGCSHRPVFTTSGSRRFEELTFTINQPSMDGHNLYAEMMEAMRPDSELKYWEFNLSPESEPQDI